MSFPTIVTSTSGIGSGSGAVQAVALPSGIAAGDLIFAAATMVINSGNAAIEPTWPAGWTKVAAVNTGGFEGVWGMVYYRVATGGETSVNVTGPDLTCGIGWQTYRITGYSGVPIANAAAGTFSPNPNPPNLVSGFGAVDTMWWAFSFGSNNTVSITSYPSGYSGGTQRQLGATFGGYMANARKESAAASEDPGVYTVTVQPRWGAITAAIQGAAVPPASYVSTITADAPIHWWRCNDVSGDLTDSIGSWHLDTGTVGTYGVTSLLTSDTANKGVSFNNTNQTKRDATAATMPANVSIEAWLKMAGNHGNNGIAGAWDGAGAMVLLGIGVTDGIRFYTGGSFLTGPTLTVGTTYHIVCTYDGTNRRIYLNGSLTHGPTAGAAITSPAVGFQISGYAASTVIGLTAAVDEVALYDYALSAAQVSAHYAAGIASPPAGGSGVRSSIVIT